VRAVAQWARHNDGAARAADAVEAFALRRAGDPTAR